MLEGRVALILGGARGVGAATALMAGRYGARLIVHGRAPSDALSWVASQLACPALTCDVRDGFGVETLIRSAWAIHGRIDVIVNSFGMTNVNKHFLEQDDVEWRDALDVNLLGVVRVCRTALPMMKAQRYGRIINVSSIRGFTDSTGRAAYSAAKGAVNTLTAALAREFAPDVLLNAVAPSFVATDMSASWSEEARAQVAKSLIPRAATPEEIAEVVCFLASERARFMTGQVISVDGGYRVAGR